MLVLEPLSFEDDEHVGHPSTSKIVENIDRIDQLIHKDYRLMIHHLAINSGISYGICQVILTEILIMWLIATKFVP